MPRLGGLSHRPRSRGLRDDYPKTTDLELSIRLHMEDLQVNRDYPKTVTLKDGRTAAIRPLAHGDFDKLFAFFQAMPEDDRIFFRHDTRDPDLIRKWTEKIDFDNVVPLVAEDGDEIVGEGTLQITTHGWMRHVGLIRLVTARAHRRNWLGTFIVKELVAAHGGSVGAEMDHGDVRFWFQLPA